MPAPATAPGVGGDGVDVSGDHVGFGFVERDRRSTIAVVDRVYDVEQFPGALAIAQFGEGHSRPDGGVGVLAAVFAHAGYITFDIARVHGGLVEGWIEQLDNALVAAHQMFIE